jgi:hypothetical protein
MARGKDFDDAQSLFNQPVFAMAPVGAHSEHNTVEQGHIRTGTIRYHPRMTSRSTMPLSGDRPNTRLAALVDAALDVQNAEGMRAAALLLTEAGASFATIGRVLCDQTQRRRGS